LNRKQEKRFWSADQKRFVYSLRRFRMESPFAFTKKSLAFYIRL